MLITKPITDNLRKLVKSLHSKDKRDEFKLFIAEGERLCSELPGSNYTTELVILRGGFGNSTEELALKFNKLNIPIYIARKQQFDVLSDTKSPQDIIAVVRIPESNIVKETAFIALDSINDPGNIGTIIRTADWFGFRNIILGGESADKFNSKVVRASMGSLFRLNIVQTENLPEYIKNQYKGYYILGAALGAEKKIEDIEPPGRFGLVFGSEAWGISPEVADCLDDEFIITGKGKAESLNVAVSAGIACHYFSKFL